MTQTSTLQVDKDDFSLFDLMEKKRSDTYISSSLDPAGMQDRALNAHRTIF